MIRRRAIQGRKEVVSTSFAALCRAAATRFRGRPFAPRAPARVSLAVLAVLRPLKRERHLRRLARPVGLKAL
jgi:hypothetical protein